MIVVDTTVLGDLLFNEERLRKSARELQRLDGDWISMALVRYELGNVARSHAAFGNLEVVDAELGIDAVEQMLVETVADADWVRILRIAVAEGLSFYDASYVWLARSRGLDLRTRDKGILAKCPDVAIPMPEV